MPHFIKTGFWKLSDKPLKGWLPIEKLFPSFSDIPGAPVVAAIENEYLNMVTAYADQSNQTTNSIQYIADASAHPDVESGGAYFEYLGTNNGDATDYRLLSDSEAAFVSSNVTKTSELINDGQDGTSPYVPQSALDGKANLVHTHVEADITDLDKYTQTEVNDLINPLKSTVVNQTVSGTVNLDLSTNIDTWVLTMTGATTFTASNYPPNTDANKRTFTIWLTGSFAFTLPTGWQLMETKPYNGTILNVITFEVLDQSTPTVKAILTPFEI